VPETTIFLERLFYEINQGFTGRSGLGWHSDEKNWFGKVRM